jgi:hypothetical protein
MRYCATCKKEVEDDEEVCRTCGNPTVANSQAPEKKKPAVRRVISPAAGEAAEVVPFKPAPNPTPEPVRHTETDEPPPVRPSGATRVRSASGGHRFVGEAELEAFRAEGYEIYLIAGIGGVGKTELLAAFRQDGFLEGFQRQDGMVRSTIQLTLNCHPIHFGNRKILFVDAAGEDFRLLYPDVHTGVEVTAADVSFLGLIARSLRGLILLVDLERLWDERMHADPVNAPYAQQVEILAWILSLLRWLTFDGQYDQSNPIKFTKHVDASVKRMRKKLKMPVQVLYSKADQLKDFPLPQTVRGTDWLHQGSATPRVLHPVGEDPFLFTYHCLRGLYAAMDIHADHYRFDFAHSLRTSKGAGTIVDPDPCGVSLAIQWLLDPAWSSRFTPMISTRSLVAFQRRLDQVLGRGRRWMRLPDPKEIRA